MSVSTGSDDSSDASAREVLESLLSKWKLWFAVLGSVAIAGMALRPASEAPEGYVPFFIALAALGVLYGVERMRVAPNPVEEHIMH